MKSLSCERSWTIRRSAVATATLSLALSSGFGCSPQAGGASGAQSPSTAPALLADAPAGAPVPAPPPPRATGTTPVPQIVRDGFGVDIALHPGGKVFAVASGSDVVLYDVETAAQRARLNGSKDKRTLAFTPDGALLLAGGIGAEIEAWDLATGERRVYGKEDDIVFSILPVPGNGWVIGTRSRVGWRGKLDDASRNIGPSCSSYAVHPQARTLYCASAGVVAWNLDSGQELWRRSQEGSGQSGQIAVRPDGKLVAWSPDGERMVLHDAGTGAPVSTLPNLTGCSWPRFSPSGHRLAVRSSRGVHLFDAARRTQLALLDKQSTQALGFSPDSRWLGTVSERGVHVVRADDGAAAGFLPVRGRRGDVAWSPDSGSVIGRLSGNRHAVWNVSGQRRAVVEREPLSPRHFAWAPDGHHVVVLDWNRSFIVDARTATVSEQLRIPGERSRFAASAWSPDGRSLALGTHTSLFLQNRSTGELRTLLNDSQFSVLRKPLFSPDGRMLLMVGTRDGAPILFAHYGVQQPRSLASVGHVSEAAWRGDSAAIAFGGETELKLYDLQRDQVTSSAPIPSHIMRAAWLGNDRLVTAHATGEVLVWRVGRSQPERTLLSAREESRQVAVSADGRWMAAMTRKGLVRIWDTKAFALVLTDQGDGREGTDLAWVPCSQTLSALRGELAWMVPGGRVMALNLLEPDRGDTPELLMTRADGAYAGTPAGVAALRLRGSGPLLSAPLQTAGERPDLHAPDIGSPWLGRCGGR